MSALRIDWVGTAMALLAGMGVAGVWYGKVFVALWWRLTGITPDQSKAASRRNMAQLWLANAVTAVGLAVAVTTTSSATGTTSVRGAVGVGLAAWLAFSATTLFQHNAFELKSPRLTILNCAYQLVLFVAMSAVIGIV